MMKTDCSQKDNLCGSRNKECLIRLVGLARPNGYTMHRFNFLSPYFSDAIAFIILAASIGLVFSISTMSGVAHESSSYQSAAIAL